MKAPLPQSPCTGDCVVSSSEGGEGSQVPEVDCLLLLHITDSLHAPNFMHTTINDPDLVDTCGLYAVPALPEIYRKPLS